MIDWLRVIHVSAGFVALFGGIFPMLSKKGMRLHKFSGKVFVISMTIVFFTAVPLAVASFNVFLFSIAFFSQYMVYSGFRYVAWKSKEDFKPFDIGIIVITILISILMITYSLITSLQSGVINGAAIILFIFGIICFWFPLADFIYFRNQSKENNRRWFYRHLIRMISAYIAASTAFLVNNISILPPIITWMVPSILGTISIIITIRHYKALE